MSFQSSQVSRDRGTLRTMPQLDGLRALAVISVVVFHYWFRGHPGGWVQLDYGLLGVRLFFVLSGFLITGILLRTRAAAEVRQELPLYGLRQFYIRRFLRIFPLYYGVLFLMALLAVDPIQKIWPWLISYTSNFFMASTGQWTGVFGHFWTLAVEEQFYLIWPLVVLFAPKKLLIPLTSLLVMLGPLYRWWAIRTAGSSLAVVVFPFASCDSLGLGALLAIGQHFRGWDVWSKRARMLLLAAIIGAVTIHVVGLIEQKLTLSTVAFPLLLGVVLAWVIGGASHGFSGLPGMFLELRPLRYVGKISYGLYVWHNFVPHGYWLFFHERLGWDYWEGGKLNFVLSSTTTFILAALSWHLFEKPINALKRYFEYLPSSSISKSKRKVQLAMDYEKV